MKANLSQSEPNRIASWKANKIYEKMVAKAGANGKFVMPDGPPYANGKIHVGHVLNKVLKDITIKYRNLAGYKAAFIPGWDCHGLPIELNVTKKLGPKRKEMTDVQVRDLCRQEAMIWKEKQQSQFERLGILADWEHPYLTLQPEYEAEEVRVLAKILKNGIFVRGEKPVYWCPTLQTALAAAEVEYRPHKSPSVYVKFALKDDPQTSFVIWTTTPWTLPANYGLAVHAQYDYGYYKTDDGETLILAKDLKETFEKETGLSLHEVKTAKGATFEKMKARHPFLDRDSLVILGDHVTLDAGTGVVHTAPGHGMDDYIVGLKYGLPVFSPVNEAGRFTADVPDLEGVSIWDANGKIIERLKASGHLLGFKEIEHSYPHNPRSKTPLIFRATPQWFIRMDDDAYPLREKCLNEVHERIRFVPDWGKQRMVAMLSNSPDWCVSRQRIWGVPIPVYYCAKCDTPLVEADVMNRLADEMESSKKGLEIYHSEPPSKFTNDHRCEKCGNGEFKRGKDILDVWFDSGVCHAAVQRRRPELDFPADIYLEGSDQHRGWFQTSLVSAMASEGAPPFKALVTHGFVNDAQGYKMSKSLGNTVDPEDILKESGAEILRLWVSHEDYGEDLTISKEKIKRMTDTYRRFRNTIRFMLGNLSDFDPQKDRVDFKDMTPLDRWALHQLHALIEKCQSAYENFEYYKVYHALNHFFTVDLSATYLDILKDRLYTGKVDGVKRRGAQTVIHQTLTALTSLMAPILTFLAEETHEYLPGRTAESVLLTDFPTAEPQWHQPDLSMEFERLLEIRAQAAKAIEELRRNKTVGSSLDAQIEITAGEKDLKLLEAYRDHLREFFIVSKVSVRAGSDLQIDASHAPGTKCERCWYYDPDTGKNPDFPGMCPKCVEALS